MTDHPPSHEKPAFDCPHCNAYAQHTWYRVHEARNDSEGVSVPVDLSLAECLACAQRSIWRLWRDGYGGNIFDMASELIWPRSGLEGPDPHQDLPEDLRPVYEEARACLPVSPRASSALVRLTLEGVLTELYPDRDLNGMIGAAAAAGLPDEVIMAMDVLRFSGNRSIHELQQEDDVETATALFVILNLVVERLITLPRQITAMHEAMPERVRAGIQRRDTPKP